jgi:hypothetical protein
MVPITLAAVVVGGLGALLSATGIGAIVGIPLVAVAAVVFFAGLGVTWLVCLPFGGFGIANTISDFDTSSADAFMDSFSRKLDDLFGSGMGPGWATN